MRKRWVRAMAIAPLWMACSATAARPSPCLPTSCQTVSGLDASGHCIFAAKADGTACDDDNSCTAYDTCQRGVCTGGTTLADGAVCDDDNACTQDDTCQQGVCRGGNALVCGAPGTCQASGSCDPQAGCLTSDTGPCVDSLASVPLSGCSITEYTVPMRIGGDVFDMLLDSGSSTTAVAAGACSNCNTVTPRYQASQGTYQNQSTNAGYVDGSGWYASVYKDTVQAGRSGDGAGPAAPLLIASITKQLDFFTGTNCLNGSASATAEGYQGILGLGPEGSLRPYTQSFPAALAETGSLAHDAFSMQLCHIGGRMWFGGYSPEASAGSIVFTPLLNAQNGDGNHYSISVEDMRIGSQSVGASSYVYGSVMVDSGTSSTYLPQDVYASLKGMLTSNANVKRYVDTRVFESDDGDKRFSYPSPVGASPAQIDAALPWMTIVVPSGGPNPSHKLLLPPSKSYLMPWRRSLSGPIQYLYSFTLLPSDLTILGSSVLKTHVVVFDREGRRIGLLPQVSFCPSDLPVSG